MNFLIIHPVQSKPLKTISKLATIIPSLLFGYPKLLMNHSNGISSDGYFVKDNKVYYDGNMIEAKPTGFQVIDEYKVYARDAEHVFFRGKT